MALYKFSDKIVFNILSDIKIGFLEITNYQGKVFKVGNPQDDLKAKLKIINPNFSFNLIKGGSIGFAESYMRGEFETDNLSNLIEITA
ncbi:class I SAM-dependent methyltransferase, partial [Candidatus Pelagibacter sp.]|nr:class I SAM-dependent methyltransferase [Candidatus Pelagibacter sp.]